MNREVAKVSLYHQGMYEAFDRFCRAIWPSSRNRASSSTARFDGGQQGQAGSTQDPPTFVFVKGDDIVGHVTTIPVQLSAFAKTVAAHWIVGFMVLPEHRNGLVGPLLIKEVNRSLDCALSLHVEPPVLRILTGLKWVHKGILPQYLRVLNARGVSHNLQLSGVGALALHTGDTAAAVPFGFVESFIRMLGGWGLAVGQAIWVGLTIVARPRAVPVEVREEQAVLVVVDPRVAGELQRAVLHAGVDAHVRDRPLEAHVDARRAEVDVADLQPPRHDGDPRMRNMKVGTIVDCLFDSAAPAVFQALLDRALKLCAREGVHAVLCTASHAAVRRLLRGNGFLAIPGNLNFAYHNRTDVPLQDIPLESWHLMRGDSDADQNF